MESAGQHGIYPNKPEVVIHRAVNKLFFLPVQSIFEYAMSKFVEIERKGNSYSHVQARPL